VHAVFGVARRRDVENMLLKRLSITLLEGNLELEGLVLLGKALQLPS
jgi:hypothetical protein